MWPEIMARVCGRPVGLACEAAWLEGYERRPVRGQEYPGIVARLGAEALRGVLYRGITAQEWARLDAFEGSEYERVQVMVHAGSADAAPEPAWVYRFRAAFVDRLGPGPWSEAAFEAEGKARFMAQYGGFRPGDAPT
jgi:gamma-glutamylcyclotransferase (GGCT)/AIG2-like uncharacterized protein YtfP